MSTYRTVDYTQYIDYLNSQTTFTSKQINEDFNIENWKQPAYQHIRSLLVLARRNGKIIKTGLKYTRTGIITDDMLRTMRRSKDEKQTAFQRRYIRYLNDGINSEPNTFELIKSQKQNPVKLQLPKSQSVIEQKTSMAFLFSNSPKFINRPTV